MLNLNLLGVSREFELEAAQLGVQYAWKAGYDPAGFIHFSDQMSCCVKFYKKGRDLDASLV